MRRHVAFALTVGLMVLGVLGQLGRSEIGVISVEKAKELIESSKASRKPIVLDTRGGYKDYFRGHIPRSHHIDFDTLRGTDQGVPVQYLPGDLTRALLIRAAVHRDRTHLIDTTGAALPNDEILSASMVAYVLEKYGVQDIRIVDGGSPAWQQAKFPVTREYFGNDSGVLSSQEKSNIGISIEELMDRKNNPNVVLVDARPKNEYLGQDDIWLR